MSYTKRTGGEKEFGHTGYNLRDTKYTRDFKKALREHYSKSKNKVDFSNTSKKVTKWDTIVVILITLSILLLVIYSNNPDLQIAIENIDFSPYFN